MNDTTKRKLSELIREGAKLRPQTQCGDFYEHDDAGHVVGSCAFGAAYEAATGETPLFDVPEFYETMEDYVDLLPDDVLFDRMVMRNDDGETREQIADWLEAEGY